MVDPADFQKLRSPSALRLFVEQEREKVCADPEDLKRGLLKKGLHKEFLDELVSISWFAVLAYPESYQINPVLGNQAYDAVVYDDLGNEVDRIEMTHPHDGAAEAEDAKLVVEKHIGKVKIGIPGDDFYALTPFVLETCRKKSKKDYSKCSLVIAIEPMKPFGGFEDSYEERVHELLGQIASIHFKARRVFLLVLPDRLEEVNFL